ncbi:hypothetical protein KUTeg_006105 [Tegillarca granosa]|uniref:Ig-like domain-containing protein n=1 Tax=Tegillarca granosa TaxID=220873 RepID=A0ABQ9FIT6_TEGGR|nr:hypothetical protein KUTeg_006105 [Tegillarca granosa]
MLTPRRGIQYTWTCVCAINICIRLMDHFLRDLDSLQVVNIIYGAQQFVTQPESKSVIENGTVTLQCKVKNREGSLQWTRDGLGLGLSRDLPGFARYTMIGASSQVGSDVIGRHCQVMQQIDERIKMKMPPAIKS